MVDNQSVGLADAELIALAQAGDALYGLKRGSERTRLAVTWSLAADLRFLAQLTGKRLAEVEALLAVNRLEHLELALDGFEESLSDLTVIAWESDAGFDPLLLEFVDDSQAHDQDVLTRVREQVPVDLQSAIKRVIEQLSFSMDVIQRVRQRGNPSDLAPGQQRTPPGQLQTSPGARPPPTTAASLAPMLRRTGMPAATPTPTTIHTTTHTPPHTTTHTQTPTSTPTPDSQCDSLTLANFNVEGQKVSWLIANGRSTTVAITAIYLDWSGVNDLLDKIELGGDAIWDRKDYDPPTSISSGWKSGVSRSVGQSASKWLLFQFGSEGALTGYTLHVAFDIGCALDWGN